MILEAVKIFTTENNQLYLKFDIKLWAMCFMGNQNSKTQHIKTALR